MNAANNPDQKCSLGFKFKAFFKRYRTSHFETCFVWESVRDSVSSVLVFWEQ